VSTKYSLDVRLAAAMYELRADGFPICPCCGEDELRSFLQWDGDGERPATADYIAAGPRCYYCGWSSTNPELRPEPTPTAVDVLSRHRARRRTEQGAQDIEGQTDARKHT
jgi:hypothetical protein